MSIRRNRTRYFLIILFTIILGLSSRTAIVPQFIYPYLGDFFYALMIYFIMGFLFPKKRLLGIAALSILICFSIEFLQLYQAQWIINLRATTLGKLVLGSGFLKSDLISYLLGVFLGFIMELWFYKRN